MESESDEKILQQVAGGDEAAMAALYDRFAPLLFAMARRLVGDEPEAREVLIDGFLGIWDKAPEYDPARGKAFCWTVTTFRNRIIDRLRASRRRLRLNEAEPGNQLDLESSFDGRSDLSAESAARAETVRRAMRSLPDEQRRCVEWAFVRGLTHLQLSELLGMPLSNVKTSIRRGLVRLRDLLLGAES